MTEPHIDEEKDLRHWAAGSNKEPVRDGVKEVSQAEDPWGDEMEEGEDN